MKEMLKKIVFAPDSSGMNTKQKTVYFGYTALIAFIALFSLTVCSLSFAYGPSYPDGVFGGYFKNILIILLNFIPVAVVYTALYAITGISWVAYLCDSLIVMTLTVANFFLLKFRDDPLMFADILYLREAISISREGYEYSLTWKMTVCFVVCILFTVLLALFHKYRPKVNLRYFSLVVLFVFVMIVKDALFSVAIYDKYTDNYDDVSRWAPTQKYVSKGFVYPFVHSIGSVLDYRPSGYSAKEAEEMLSVFEENEIPDEKKVNIIVVMLEAYNDLTVLGVEGIDDDAYSLYHSLKEQNLSGTLVTDIFSAGTKDSERAFLTGYPVINDYRTNVNSYIRYLASQGYYVDGSHPSESWFYNRQNTNEYLGFDEYRFADNYFFEKYGESMRADYILFEDIYSHYSEKTEDGDSPYFAFHVTYQGHAPYETEEKQWGTDENPLYVGENVSYETDCILNNYLGSMKDTGFRLWQFVEKIKADSKPSVVLVFGDHKPWLGDGNSVYDELGINIDVSTHEGFLNYYSTEYVIIANDAAKEVTGKNFTGTGPVTSPCFLMNVLFDELGYAGTGYMQFADTVRQKMPALNSVGVVDEHNGFYSVEDLPENLADIYDEFLCGAYYESMNFKK